MSRTHELLRRVAARQRTAGFGARFLRLLLVVAAVYLGLLLASRLGGLLPDWFRPETLVVVPAAAFVLAALTGRTPSEAEAARLVDARMKTHDLFMTAALLEESAGEYQALVMRGAEERAAGVRPAEVVPLQPWPKARIAALTLAILLLGVLALPQLDPFGRAEERYARGERRKRLEDDMRAAALRVNILKEQSAGPDSEEVARALEELKKTFNSMKPGRKKANLDRLSMVQRELGRLWRKTTEKKLADSLRRSPLSQRFGSPEGELPSQWKKELSEGKTDGLRKELDRLKEKARQLAEATDPAEREKLRNDIRQGLRRMADFAERSANSRELNSALSRAMEQLGMSGMKGLSREALQALEGSLDLTEMEFAELAKQVRELERLEDALAAAQLAKALNEIGELDGAAGAGCQAISDYASFYASLLEGMDGEKRGFGPGMRGPGTGKGGQAQEDPDAETDFKPELSRSEVTAGRMLLEWKTRGVSDPGRAREDYGRTVREVKQSWSEAMLREQVPPGYRAGIQKYFDSIKETRGDGDADASGVE